jgi:hypothetical protein
MPRKRERQQTEIAFLEFIGDSSTTQRTEKSFLERIDESSTKAWLKWAKDEEKKRRTKKTDKSAKKKG